MLTDDLVQDRYRTGLGKYDGFAYVGAEAYFHLAGGWDAGLRPMQLKHRGKSHWWLLDANGRVIDLVLGRARPRSPIHRGRCRLPLHPGRICGGRRWSWSASRPSVAEERPPSILGQQWSEAAGTMSALTIWSTRRVEVSIGSIVI